MSKTKPAPTAAPASGTSPIAAVVADVVEAVQHVDLAPALAALEADLAQAKADAARADALRQENLKRMQGLAWASGGEHATGSALKSSGPSAS